MLVRLIQVGRADQRGADADRQLAVWFIVDVVDGEADDNGTQALGGCFQAFHVWNVEKDEELLSAESVDRVLRSK